jgi:predicted PurR-regulated permease PerM
MVFLAILFGVVLRSLGDLLHRATGLRRRWAVLALVAVLVLAVAAGAAFVAPTLADQIGRLVEQVPQAADQLQRQFGDERWLGALWSQLSSGLNLPNPGEAVLLVIVRRVYIERVLESGDEPQLKAGAGLSH